LEDLINELKEERQEESSFVKVKEIIQLAARENIVIDEREAKKHEVFFDKLQE